MEGTRVLLLAELQRWSTGRLPSPADTKRIFFLSGGFGVGKSSVAYKYCMLLSDVASRTDESTPRLGASVFFDRARGAMTAQLLFPAIARQLAESQPFLRPHIIARARTYVRNGYDQLPEFSFRDLLSIPLSQAAAQTPKQIRLIVVIDGLDECADQSALQKCLAHLFKLVVECPWLYLFVASRPEPRIVTALNQDNMVYRHELNEDFTDDAEDVAMFLKAKVPISPFLENHPHYLEELIERAGGLFIFARIAVNVLRSDLFLSDPEEGFRIVLSKSSGLVNTGNSQENMDALYLGILRVAFRPDDLRRSPRIHARLLSLLYTAVLLDTGPLSLPFEIFAIFASGVRDSDYIGTLFKDEAGEDCLTTANLRPIVHTLASVLYIEEGTEKLRPLHISLYEFLLDRCEDMSYRLDEAKGRVAISSAVFSFFSPQSTKRLLGGAVEKEAVRVAAEYALTYITDFYCSGKWSIAYKAALRRSAMIEGAWVPYCMRLFVACRVNHVLRVEESIVDERFGLTSGYLEGLVRYSRLYLQHMRSHPKSSEGQISAAVHNMVYWGTTYDVESGFSWSFRQSQNEETEWRPADSRTTLLGRYAGLWTDVWRALRGDSELRQLWYEVEPS